MIELGWHTGALGEVCDEQAIPTLNSEAIDFRVASESFTDIRDLKRKDLEKLGVLTVNQNHKVPTVGGLLLYGADRLKHFPDAWIQAGRFRGIDKSTIVDAVEIRKPLHLARVLMPSVVDFPIGLCKLLVNQL